MHRVLLGGSNRALARCPLWQRKPTRGRAHKGVTTAVSSSVLALRSEQGRDISPRVATQLEKGTHHIVKRPDQGIRVPARGPSHLHPTWGNNLNPATTRSYVEVVRGVAPTSGLPTMATGPPHNARHNPYPCVPCVGKGTQHAQQRRTGEGRGFVLRSPKEGLSAGIWRRKVVMCPRRGNNSASGHPRAHQPPLGRGTSPPAWDGRLDAPGQRRRQLPSSVWTRRTEVKQGKSGGPVCTTDQGNGKGRSGERRMGTMAYGGKGQGKGTGGREGRLGQGGRGRSQGGERPMGTAAYGGKGSKGRAAIGQKAPPAADENNTPWCHAKPPPPLHPPADPPPNCPPPTPPPQVLTDS